MSADSASSLAVRVEGAFAARRAGRGCGSRRSGSRAGPRSRRPSCCSLPRQPDQQTYSGASDIFWPKPPPTSGAIDAQIGFRHAEHIGDGGAREMRHLRGAGQRDAAGRGIVGGVAAARLDRRRVLPVRARLDADDLVRAGQAASKPGVLTWPSTMTLPARFGVDRGAPVAKRVARIDHRRASRRSSTST